ncbi:ABC transporter [Colletotrichum graminicola]|uniref:ABC transporter n=1 Tax=Colletotrichum graminicola (strain M1.001 / M2 / FGSC 10212) TaxID=645133 RepID=E3QM74_COLGM|nr:ABC transporter [Colletotrichum graminicola M1.001]EFQ31962.1 ABC transporter [Colletotrichum graminicola M1.001]WDK21850.1 ABC transporter [Colletotrichum graminicola]
MGQPQEHTQDPASQWKPSWAYLFTFCNRQHLPIIGIGIVAAFICAAFRTALAVVLGRMFQVISDYGAGLSGTPDTILQTSRLGIIICCLGLGAFFGNTILLTSWVAFGELQAKVARERIFGRLLARDMSWYDKQADGIPGLLVRIETQIRELQTATSQVLGFLSTEAVTSIASFALALGFSWKLTLVLIATVPLAVISLALINRRLQSAIAQQNLHLADASKQLHACVAAIDLVKVFNGCSQEIRAYSKIMDASVDQYLVQARCNALQISVTGAWVSLLFVGGFWFGLWLVTKEENSATIITTFYATLTALGGIFNVLPQYVVLARGICAAQNLRQIIRGPLAEGPQGKPAAVLSPNFCVGEVQVKQVSFAYPSQPLKMVLDRSSFYFPAGETRFILGSSGSGKSTLGSLLVNLYETLPGKIFIDGRPLETLDKEWVRKNVTLVQQGSQLFDNTFLWNVALDQSVTADSVRAACDMSLLQSTLLSLPCGVYTKIGPSGHRLSGGQTQRLALARARLRDSPVLILDEVTSGLDRGSTLLVMEATRAWRRGKTTIIITHDISQIEQDDYVYVMDRGRVVEEGIRGILSRDPHGRFATFITHSSEKLDHQEEDTGTGRNFSYGCSISPLVGQPVHEMTQQADVDEGHRWLLRRTLFGAASFSTVVWKGDKRHTAIDHRLDSPIYHHKSQGPLKPPIHTPEWGMIPTDSTAHRWRPSIETVQTAGKIVQSARQNSTARRRWKPCELDCGMDEEVHSCNLEHKRTPGEPPGCEIKSIWTVILTILPNLTCKNKLRLIVGLVFCSVAAGCTPVFSFCFSQLLATFWAAENQVTAGREWAICLIMVAIISGVSIFLGRYLMEHVGQAWANALRLEAMKGVFRQPKSWFDDSKNSASDIGECLDRHAEEMRNLVSRFIPVVAMVVVMATISITWALSISWKLTMVALSSLPVLITASMGLSIVGTKWEAVCNEAATEAASVMHETITNINCVRALTLERHFSERHAQLVKSTYRLGLQRGLYLGPLFGLIQSTDFFVVALVGWYGMYLTAQEAEMSPNSLQQVANLLLFCIGQATALMQMMPQVSASQAAAARVLFLATLPDPSCPSKGDPGQPASLFPIIMRNVDFAYLSQPSHQILRSVNLDIGNGKCVAIVGPSGCGKSTVMSLLMRLYEPYRLHSTDGIDSGQLTYGGVASDQIYGEQFYSHISYVPQTPYLFPATVADNIAYGLAEASPLRHRSNVRRAAREAGIHNLIVSLPRGYDTVIGDGGQGLSGGQSQRVCIARALARRPRLMIMDEPTSALDSLSAERIRETIAGILAGAEDGGMSIVVATHSREMMRIAQHIIVMEAGRVVDEGSFDELQLRSKVFSTLIHHS